MSTIVRIASFFVATALLVACGRDAVERKLVGTWQTAVPASTGAYELHFTVQSNGLYRNDVLGAAPVSPEFGLLKATSGRWRLERPTGNVDEGTYEFVSDDTVLFKSKAGIVLWTRLSNDSASAVAAAQSVPAQNDLPAPSGFGPAATPSASSSQSGGPNAALLTAGPFGPAIDQPAAAFSTSGAVGSGVPSAAGFATPAESSNAAAFASPSGVASGMPSAAGFGTPAQSSPTQPRAAFQSTVQPPSNQPGASAQPLPTMTAKQAVVHAKSTVQQTASQTAATARAGAKQIESQAATSATGAVDSAAAETNKKVGQKIGTFAGNVGSKIKNFFTGGRRQDADAGRADGSAQPQDAH